ncbi:MAG: methyltransferase domain-containing protein [Pseudomonadales bacterium]|nr:methyltransferase domain-containing protein [Pseudomonadales bacterium]
MTTYDAAFFEYVNSGAVRSAEHLLPHLTGALSLSRVLDVGCGHGAWLSVWQKLGIDDITGIDGDYVNRDRLLIERDDFLARDLAEGFELGRRFDLVQSLEVAEHLPASCAARFVESIVRHGPLVLFSAAPKGQGGDHHVNEQDYDYWRALFEKHGYVALDCIRPLVAGISAIEPWYRYNVILYSHLDALAGLPDAFRRCQVPRGVRIPDVSPALYRARKLVVGMMPVPLMTRLAKAKERLVGRARGVASI